MASKLISNESARISKLIAGIHQHLSTVSSLTLANVSYTPAALTALFTSYVQLFADVQAAQATYKDKLAARDAQTAALRVIVDALVAYVRATLGSSTQVLADFGLSPTKAKKPLTTAKQFVAVEKRLSTRAARHTVGPRKKLTIKGSVAEPAPGGSPSPAPAVVSPVALAAGGSPAKAPGAQ